MSRLVWDKVGDRVFEGGVDTGVLYLQNGLVVPWNGLTSIIEEFNRDLLPVYYDGMKINDLVTLGDFLATMKAVTYPDEFVEVEGGAYASHGVLVEDQRPQTFGLAYRTKIGNDVDGDSAGYKLHIIYNVTAIPSQKQFVSASDASNLTEFEWKITAVPEDVPGYRPTAHIVLNSIDIDPDLLVALENLFYGTSTTNAALIPMPDLIDFISKWYSITVYDNGDGTWTGVDTKGGYITYPMEADLAQITNINVKYLNDTTFVIYNTLTRTGSYRVTITDNGDGTWLAAATDGSVIDNGDGTFQIDNATIVSSGADYYNITDTPA